jgi:hypothetical protein
MIFLNVAKSAISLLMIQQILPHGFFLQSLENEEGSALIAASTEITKPGGFSASITLHFFKLLLRLVDLCLTINVLRPFSSTGSSSLPLRSTNAARAGRYFGKVEVD